MRLKLLLRIILTILVIIVVIIGGLFGLNAYSDQHLTIVLSMIGIN